MDQLQALKVFVRIAEVGSFSRTADAMNIPRPTVTKLVQDLEQHLDAKLLQDAEAIELRRVHLRELVRAADVPTAGRAHTDPNGNSAARVERRRSRAADTASAASLKRRNARAG